MILICYDEPEQRGKWKIKKRGPKKGKGIGVTYRTISSTGASVVFVIRWVPFPSPMIVFSILSLHRAHTAYMGRSEQWHLVVSGLRSNVGVRHPMKSWKGNRSEKWGKIFDNRLN